MSQILLPNEDISNPDSMKRAVEVDGTTTLYNDDLYLALRDNKDNTYVKTLSIFYNTGTLTVGLPEPSYPVKSGNSTVYFRYTATGSSVCKVSLYEGTTLVGSLEKTDSPSGSVVQTSFSVNISDYSDLRLKIYLDLASFRMARCHKAWVAVPDVGNPCRSGLEMGVIF